VATYPAAGMANYPTASALPLGSKTQYSPPIATGAASAVQASTLVAVVAAFAAVLAF